MAQFRNYNPLKVVAAFNGVILQGFSDGDMISCERSSDAFSTVVGAGGDVTRVRSHDKTGMVTFTLMAESPSNSLLTLAYQADQLLGLGRGALYIQNLNGLELVDASECWIQKLPNITYAKDGAGTREWVIACAELSMAPAGALT